MYTQFLQLVSKVIFVLLYFDVWVFYVLYKIGKSVHTIAIADSTQCCDFLLVHLKHQVGALKDYYDELAEVNANEALLSKCDYIGHKVIPTLALIFIGGYWLIGLLKYIYPNWEFLDDVHKWEIFPTYQV